MVTFPEKYYGMGHIQSGGRVRKGLLKMPYNRTEDLSDFWFRVSSSGRFYYLIGYGHGKCILQVYGGFAVDGLAYELERFQELLNIPSTRTEANDSIIKKVEVTIRNWYTKLHKDGSTTEVS